MATHNKQAEVGDVEIRYRVMSANNRGYWHSVGYFKTLQGARSAAIKHEGSGPLPDGLRSWAEIHEVRTTVVDVINRPGGD